MRNILNISLPKEMVVDIKREVKAGKFASTSEFMRHLIRMWNTRKLAEEFKKGRYDKNPSSEDGVLPLGKACSRRLGELRKRK